MDDYRARVLDALETQRNTIAQSRQHDFDALLLESFKTADDSIAVSLREALTEPTDSALFIEAGKWFEQRNN